MVDSRPDWVKLGLTTLQRVQTYGTGRHRTGEDQDSHQLIPVEQVAHVAGAPAQAQPWWWIYAHVIQHLLTPDGLGVWLTLGRIDGQEWFTFYADNIRGEALQRFGAVVRANDERLQHSVYLSTSLLRDLAEVAKSQGKVAPLALLLDFSGDRIEIGDDRHAATVPLYFKPASKDHGCWKSLGTQTGDQDAYVAALNTAACAPPQATVEWIADYLGTHEDRLRRFSAWVQDLEWPRTWNYLLAISANPVHVGHGQRGAAVLVYLKQSPQDLDSTVLMFRSAAVAAYELESELTFKTLWEFLTGDSWGHGIGDLYGNTRVKCGRVFAQEASKYFGLNLEEVNEGDVPNADSHPHLYAAYQAARGFVAVKQSGDDGYDVRLGTIALLLLFLARKRRHQVDLSFDASWSTAKVLPRRGSGSRRRTPRFRRAILEEFYRLFSYCEDDGSIRSVRATNTGERWLLCAKFNPKPNGSADDLKQHLEERHKQMINGHVWEEGHRTSLSLCRIEMLSGLDVVIGNAEPQAGPHILYFGITEDAATITLTSLPTLGS